MWDVLIKFLLIKKDVFLFDVLLIVKIIVVINFDFVIVDDSDFIFGVIDGVCFVGYFVLDVINYRVLLVIGFVFCFGV